MRTNKRFEMHERLVATSPGCCYLGRLPESLLRVVTGGTALKTRVFLRVRLSLFTVDKPQCDVLDGFIKSGIDMSLMISDKTNVGPNNAVISI